MNSKKNLISVYMVDSPCFIWIKSCSGSSYSCVTRQLSLDLSVSKELALKSQITHSTLQYLHLGICRAVTIILHHRVWRAEHCGIFRSLYYGCGNKKWYKYSFFHFLFLFLPICMSVLLYSANPQLSMERKQRCLSSVNLHCLCILKFYSQDYNSKPVGKL